MIQDFKDHDEVLEYAAKLIEDTDITDLMGIWAKRKRAREDAELRLKTAGEIRKRCAEHIRAMKHRPELGPVEKLKELFQLDDKDNHVLHLRDAWPLAWKGWLNIECVLRTNNNCLPPETRYRIVLTDKGREILFEATP